MLKMLLVVLIAAGGMGWAQEAAQPEKDLKWIVWIDAAYTKGMYKSDWSPALKSVLDSMKPGEAGILYLAGSKHHFIRTGNETQLEDLNAMVREKIEKLGEPIRLLKDEYWKNHVTDSFLRENRNHLLACYAKAQKEFWNALDDGQVGENTRLLVMIQQFDMYALDPKLKYDNDKVGAMDLFMDDPWVEKSERIEKIVKRFKDRKSPVDVLYFKADDRLDGFYRGRHSSRELSKGFLQGVMKLSKISGGKSDTVPYEKSYLYAVN